MGKYDPLTDYLATRRGRRITMSFGDIERVLGVPLPNSKRIRAWWSNNADNNVMTSAWLAAGFKSSEVDIENERLTFIPSDEVAAEASTERTLKRHPARGALKGTATWPDGADLMQPLEVEWEAGADGAAS